MKSHYKNQEQNQSQPQHQSQDPSQMIPINGFKQIIDMLSVADPAFRESLLKRIAARDLQLANSLRRDLRQKLANQN